METSEAAGSASERDERLGSFLDEALSELRAGRVIDPAHWRERYPDLADELPALLETLRELDTALEDWKPDAAPTEVLHPIEGQLEESEFAARPIGMAASSVEQLALTSPEVTARHRAEPLPDWIGRYRITEFIGAGGMGTVYKAHDPQLGRVVAVKVPKFDVSQRDAPAHVQRFLRGARAAAQVRDPHVCPIYDVGEHNGRPFVVMAYVEGQSLDALLERRRFKNPADAVRLIVQVARGLAAVHAHSLIHRDIKPGNILVDGAGQAVLTDFGLARPEGDPERVTADGMVVGTPAYMSPEQAPYESDRLGPWSDIYSLGVVLYRMLTGRLPFHGSASEIVRKVTSQTPPDPCSLRPDLDPALGAILCKAMARRPDDRYGSARELGDALDRWLAQTPVGPASANDRQFDPAIGTQDRPATDASRGEATRSWTPTGPPAGDAAKLVAAELGESAREPSGGGVVRSDAPNRRRRLMLVATAAAVLLMSAAVIAPQILIRIGKKGEKEMTLPPGTEVEITQGGKVVVRLPGDLDKPTPPTKPGAQVIRPGRAARAVDIGLGPLALVNRPAPLVGVSSWTIETREPRGEVSAAAYSRDGRRLATAGRDGTIRIWEQDGSRLIRVLMGHADTVHSLAWSSTDAGLLASGSADGTVRIWNVESGELVGTLEGHQGWVRAVAWSADGKVLASAGVDNAVVLWDAESRRMLHTLEHNLVSCLAWSPVGLTLASGGGDRFVRLWDGDTSGALKAFEHNSGVSAVAWSHNGRRLISGSYDGTVWFRDPTADRLLRTLMAHQGQVTAMALSPDGETLATGSAGGVLSLWEADSGHMLRTTEAHKGTVNALAWSPRDGTLASAGTDSTVQFWRASSGQLLRKMEGNAGYHAGFQPVAWSPDGETLASGGDQWVRLWSTESGELRRVIHGRAGLVNAVAWSPNGEMLASAQDGEVQVWVADTGRSQCKLEWSGGQVNALAWSRDGATLAVAGADTDMRIFAVDSGKLVRTLHGQSKGIGGLAWSPNGAMLAAASGAQDGVVQLWRAEAEEPLRVIPIDKAGAVALAWSPDSRVVAASSTDGVVHLWEAPSGRAVRELQTGGFHCVALAWSPDARMLATANLDGAVRLWEPDTGRMVRTLAGHKGGARAVSWSPDSGILASSGADGLVRVWEADTGRPRALLIPLRGGEGLTLSADGHYLCPPAIEEQLLYVIQTDQVQETFAPKEFAEKFNWKNDPDRVSLIGR